MENSLILQGVSCLNLQSQQIVDLGVLKPMAEHYECENDRV